jgi:hypothetical protein
MKLTRKVCETRNQKTVDFVIGFIGFIILNGVLWGVGQLVAVAAAVPLWSLNQDTLNTVYGVVGLLLICLPLVINIGLIVFFAFTHYWIALGALGAFAAALVITICIAVVLAATCFLALGNYNP